MVIELHSVILLLQFLKECQRKVERVLWISLVFLWKGGLLFRETSTRKDWFNYLAVLND